MNVGTFSERLQSSSAKQLYTPLQEDQKTTSRARHIETKLSPKRTHFGFVPIVASLSWHNTSNEVANLDPLYIGNTDEFPFPFYESKMYRRFIECDRKVRPKDSQACRGTRFSRREEKLHKMQTSHSTSFKNQSKEDAGSSSSSFE
jgi:hypothetical protein